MSDPSEVRYGLVVQREPGQPDPRWQPAYYPSTNRAVDVLLLSQEIVGIMVHWTGDTVRPCRDLVEPCAYCRSGEPVRWAAYAAAYDPATRRTCLVTIPEQAYRSCPVLHQLAGELRGRRLRLRRHGDGRVSAQLSDYQNVDDMRKKLPPAFDVLESVAFRWGLIRFAEAEAAELPPEEEDPLTEGL